MPLNHLSCPECGKQVDDRAPACPHCGTKIYVEHPGDLKGVKHRPLPPPPGKPQAIAPAAEEETFPPPPFPSASEDPKQAD